MLMASNIIMKNVRTCSLKFLCLVREIQSNAIFGGFHYQELLYSENTGGIMFVRNIVTGLHGAQSTNLASL
jgi:hypothetical protein